MTGTQIRKLRESIGFERPRFAELLGISPSTVLRWEKVGDEEAKVEGLAANLLALMAEYGVDYHTVGFWDWVQKGVLVGGPLLGLRRLLSRLEDDG